MIALSSVGEPDESYISSLMRRRPIKSAYAHVSGGQLSSRSVALGVAGKVISGCFTDSWG